MAARRIIVCRPLQRRRSAAQVQADLGLYQLRQRIPRLIQGVGALIRNLEDDVRRSHA